LDDVIYSQNTNLSNSSNELREIPRKIFSSVPLDPKKIVKVVRGSNFACFLVQESVYCTGTGNNGELGNGKISSSQTPILIDTSGALKGLTVSEIAAGNNHVCVIASSRVFCWGSNYYGQAGASDERDAFDSMKIQMQLSPIEVTSDQYLRDKKIESLSVAGNASCVVASGEPICWGQLPTGYQGKVSANTSISGTPVALINPGDLKRLKVSRIFISARAKSSMCVLAEGKPYCWSNSPFTGGEVSSSSVPIPVDLSVIGKRQVSDIAIGPSHMCALALGDLYCWGNNLYGALGIGSNESSTTPVKMKVSNELVDREIISVAIDNLNWSYPTTIFLHKKLTDTTKLSRKSIDDAEAAAIAEAKAAAQRELEAASKVAQEDMAAAESERQKALLGNINTNPLVKPVSLALMGVSTFKVDGALVPHSMDPENLFEGKTPTAVYVGTSSSCALAGGSLYCWGNGSSGQLGDGSFRSSALPKKVKFPDRWARASIDKVAIGGNTSCAILDGDLLCWGNNSNFQLGNNSQNNSATPTSVDSSGVLKGLEITDVSVGNGHVCAIADSKAFCWGANGSNQIGTGSTESKVVQTPVAVNTTGLLKGKKLLGISVSDYHSCAYSTTEVFCWGQNSYSALGSQVDSSGVAQVKFPLEKIIKIQQLSAGYFGTCAVIDGRAFCWGFNNAGRFAISENTISSSGNPIALEMKGNLLGREFQNISLGINFACGIASGSPYCWGSNAQGQLGNGNLKSNTTPAQVASPDVVAGKTYSISVSPNGATVCAVASGKVYCWGGNSEFQGGRLDSQASTSPTPVGSGFVDLQFSSSIALQQQQEYGSYSILNESKPYLFTPSVSEDLKPTSYPVALSNLGSLANQKITHYFKRNQNECFVMSGDIYCRGQNDRGQLGNGSTNYSEIPVLVDKNGVLKNTTVSKIVMGTSHACTLSSGKVYCWGDNTAGQLGISNERDSFGSYRTQFSTVPVAIDISGALKGKKITDIESSNYTTCVIATGEVFCWGALNYSFMDGSKFMNSGVALGLRFLGALKDKTVTRVAMAPNFGLLCALAEERAYCANSSFYSSGSLEKASNSPVLVGDKSFSQRPVSDISISDIHACAISMGELFCWGSNSSGQLGTGDRDNRPLPSPVKSGSILNGREVFAIALSNSNTLIAHRALTAEKAMEWDESRKAIALIVAEEERLAKEKAEAEVQAQLLAERTSKIKELQSEMILARDSLIEVIDYLVVECFGNTRDLSAEQRLLLSRTSISLNCNKYSELKKFAQNALNGLTLSDMSNSGFANSSKQLSNLIDTFEMNQSEVSAYFGDINKISEDLETVIELERRYESSAVKYFRDWLNVQARVDKLPTNFKNSVSKIKDYQSATKFAAAISVIRIDYENYRKELKLVTTGGGVSDLADRLADIVAGIEEYENFDLQIRGIEKAIPAFICVRGGTATALPKTGKCPTGAKKVSTK
jgi:alpha-tubulin suppressor-like RCC1 family protein